MPRRRRAGEEAEPQESRDEIARPLDPGSRAGGAPPARAGVVDLPGCRDPRERRRHVVGAPRRPVGQAPQAAPAGHRRARALPALGPRSGRRARPARAAPAGAGAYTCDRRLPAQPRQYPSGRRRHQRLDGGARPRLEPWLPAPWRAVCGAGGRGTRAAPRFVRRRPRHGAEALPPDERPVRTGCFASAGLADWAWDAQ